MRFGKALVLGAVSLGVFWLVFGLPGTFLSQTFRVFLEFVHPILIPAGSNSPFYHFLLDIVNNGIIPVVILLLSLLPQIIILFAIVESLNFFGVSKTSPILLGFGCTTVALSSDENINPRTSRFLAFVPCGAKIPVVLMLSSFLGNFGFLFIYFIYIVSIFVGFLVAKPCLLCSHEVTREKDGFRIERITKKTLEFLRRISAPVIISAVVLHFLSVVGVLYPLARAVSLVLAPIGLNYPVVIIALLFGLLAKEMALVAFAIFGTAFCLSAPQAASLIAFFILYPVCIPALTVMTKKHGYKFTLKTVTINFATAYVVSFLVYQLMLLLV